MSGFRVYDTITNTIINGSIDFDSLTVISDPQDDDYLLIV